MPPRTTAVIALNMLPGCPRPAGPSRPGSEDDPAIPAESPEIANVDSADNADADAREAGRLGVPADRVE